MSSVAKNIRKIRTARQITQEDLAARLYVTRQTISNWETNRSQPDVDTLQKLAAILDVEITELIYGEPVSPSLQKVRKKWIRIGTGLSAALAAAILAIVLICNGTTGTWSHGLSYLFWNSDYTVDVIQDPSRYSINLDLFHPESNAGKVLYEDQGCKIVVDSVYFRNDRCCVDLTAHGSYNRTGGSFVSACYPAYVNKTSYQIQSTGWMYTQVGSNCYDSTLYYTSSLIYKDGNGFGFYLFPLEQYENGKLLAQDAIDRANGIVTVTVGGLTALQFHRISYWGLFG